MKILFGTGNFAKLSAMKRRLESLTDKYGIEFIGLNDLNMEIPLVLENGSTPLENAHQKAVAYYNAFQIPVFSCDSGLYFDNVPKQDQPGVHVRTVNGKTLTDEEMLVHYAGLARKYNNLTARYKNAICFVYDETHLYEAMEPSMESEAFVITTKPHSTIRKKGFPIDSLSIDIKSGKYYYDLPEQELEQIAVEDGFLQFFEHILEEIKGL
ncbi:dITP/XTP pyrophosphatase [Lachnospiraceae bacterium]|nr:dITP/XTP pyrophosphatase [Lachnospiraceae bacterium]